MQLVLLSGGSGRRLWPLSNDARSKQFLKLLESQTGEIESMAQRIYKQLKSCGLEDSILISTNAKQKDAFINQIGDKVSILTEPERRDTFAAILFACSYLYSNRNCSLDESVVVMPCDQFVDDSYFETITQIAKEVEMGDTEIVLMGIKPTAPSTKYGYIIPDSVNGQYRSYVKSFKEKPNYETAKEYIAQNALWNGGVFGFKLGYILNLTLKYLQDYTFETVKNNFSRLPKISFDYEVVERANTIKYVQYSGKWEDLGTWESLLPEIKHSIIGNGLMIEGCKGVQLINELSIPVICSGLTDIAVISSYDGILVTNKNNANNIKDAVDSLVTRPLYEERRWGTYKVIDHQTFKSGFAQLTKQIVLFPGKSISYQLHHYRDEIWTVVDGEGLFILDGKIQSVKYGDVLNIKAEQKHAVKAISQLTLIEVQIGSQVNEDDIERFNWDWEIE